MIQTQCSNKNCWKKRDQLTIKITTIIILIYFYLLCYTTMDYSTVLEFDWHTIKSKIAELKKQLGELQLKKSIAVSTVKDTSQFKKIKKSIAQLSFRLSTINL